nr:methyltransferase [Saccharopolyspora pogona]
MAHRCEVGSGDILDSVRAGADVYLMPPIQHDWKRHNLRACLAQVREAPTARSKVLPDNDEPRLGKRLDLVMAALTHCRERTAAEYRALLARAGLRVESHIATGSASSMVVAVLG